MNDTSMPDADPKPRTKHRKSTCAGCRRRKSKCDGRVPSCTTCIAYKDECRYDKPPSLAYVRSLEEQVHELKAELRQIKSQSWTKVPSTEDKKILVTSPASDALSQQSSGQRNRPPKWEADISVDDHGSVAFHNSTSAVHEPPDNSALHPVHEHSVPALPHNDQMRRDLVMNATQQRQIEPYAIANGAVKVNIPKELSLELLKYHWCWIHPLFLFVYRPAFIRGMALIDYSNPDLRDPPYFSDTLLKVMHAHCARFLNHDVYQHHYQTTSMGQSPVTQTFSAQDFMQKLTDEARHGLGMDMLQPSSIPTIQALLQQSAREVVFGRSSQAWTFAGVAFRMALDMGIHLPSDRLQSFVKSLTPEDIEVRKRLFWACWSWDKILSLYLGRMPGFAHPTEDIPVSFMDDYSDSDLWAPYYGETPKPDHAQAPNYSPCPGYVVSCFQQNCRLCVILNDLMQSIYSPEAAARRDDEENSAEAKAANEEPFIRISRDLREWYIALPIHLRINADQMPNLAPPVHIMSLNLLYHTTVILLHRPVILGARDPNAPGPSRSYQNCLQATAAIHDLLILQSNTFGLSHVSYLNAYAAYIAATIAVLRFEREHQPAEDPSEGIKRAGLTFLLEVLKRTAAAMPALERSDAIIRKRIQAVIDRYGGLSVRRSSQASSIPIATPPYSIPTTHDMSLAQPTAFQTISAAQSLPNMDQQQVPYTPTSTILSADGTTTMNQHAASTAAHNFVAPLQWQSDLRSSLYTSPPPPSTAAHTMQVSQSMPQQQNTIHHHQHHPSHTSNTPSQHNNHMLGSLDDFLPAFPGQQFPIALSSEQSFSGMGGLDVDSRAALLGYSLDPHPRLNVGNFGAMEGEVDWRVLDSAAGAAGVAVSDGGGFGVG